MRVNVIIIATNLIKDSLLWLCFFFCKKKTVLDIVRFGASKKTVFSNLLWLITSIEVLKKINFCKMKIT